MATILVLEDDLLVRTMIRRMLRPLTLIEAASAEEALQRFAEHGCEVDLLMADVTLPISSGIQVALQIRSSAPGLPVILTSGSGVSDWHSRDAADLERLDMDSLVILQKPFEREDLLGAIRALLGGGGVDVRVT